MLTMRKRKGTTWVLWRGGFLRYAADAEDDFVTTRDQWACEQVESIGLDPTVKPGKQVYLKLCDANFKLYQELRSMTTQIKLFWTPPAMLHDPDLAIILNKLIGDECGPIYADDAALHMAWHNKRIELEAKRDGITLVPCNMTARSIMRLINNAFDGEVTKENVAKCLEAFVRTHADELEVA